MKMLTEAVLPKDQYPSSFEQTPHSLPVHSGDIWMGRPLYEEDLATMGESLVLEQTTQVEVGHEYFVFGMWMCRDSTLLSTGMSHTSPLLSTRCLRAEAALSLQSAARRFLQTQCAGKMGQVEHVCLTSSCEINAECQLVLKNTYGHCNFKDILTLDMVNGGKAFCTTHGRLCKITHSSKPGRSLTSTVSM